jgi:hypothetical protein
VSDETQEKGPEDSRLTAADMLVNSQMWQPIPCGQCSSTCPVYECTRAMQDLRELRLIIVTQQSEMQLERLTACVPLSRSACERCSVCPS